LLLEVPPISTARAAKASSGRRSVHNARVIGISSPPERTDGSPDSSRTSLMPQTGPFVRPATSQQRAIGVLLLAAAFLYMWRFVPRGWIPHDAGQIGEAAEWILHGRIPHVDYEDPYTGGLSFAYALLFRLTGIELLHVRW